MTMRTTTTILLLQAAVTAAAQCTQAVPSNATVVTADPATGSYTGQNVWVCDIQGAFLGSQSTYFIEDGAFVAINGNNNTVYSKTGLLYLGGNNNIVYVEGSTGLVTDQGTGNAVSSCPSMTFNYGSAPAAGCSGVGIVEISLDLVQIHPTTSADGRITVETRGAWLDQVLVMNALGQQVMAVPGKGLAVIDMSALGKGVYFLRLMADGQERVQRITLR